MRRNRSGIGAPSGAVARRHALKRLGNAPMGAARRAAMAVEMVREGDDEVDSMLSRLESAASRGRRRTKAAPERVLWSEEMGRLRQLEVSLEKRMLQAMEEIREVSLDDEFSNVGVLMDWHLDQRGVRESLANALSGALEEGRKAIELDRQEETEAVLSGVQSALGMARAEEEARAGQLEREIIAARQLRRRKQESQNEAWSGEKVEEAILKGVGGEILERLSARSKEELVSEAFDALWKRRQIWSERQEQTRAEFNAQVSKLSTITSSTFLEEDQKGAKPAKYTVLEEDQKGAKTAKYTVLEEDQKGAKPAKYTVLEEDQKGAKPSKYTALNKDDGNGGEELSVPKEPIYRRVRIDPKWVYGGWDRSEHAAFVRAGNGSVHKARKLELLRHRPTWDLEMHAQWMEERLKAKRRMEEAEETWSREREKILEKVKCDAEKRAKREDEMRIQSAKAAEAEQLRRAKHRALEQLRRQRKRAERARRAEQSAIEAELKAQELAKEARDAQRRQEAASAVTQFQMDRETKARREREEETRKRLEEEQARLLEAPERQERIQFRQELLQEREMDEERKRLEHQAALELQQQRLEQIKAQVPYRETLDKIATEAGGDRIHTHTTASATAAAIGSAHARYLRSQGVTRGVHELRLHPTDDKDSDALRALQERRVAEQGLYPERGVNDTALFKDTRFRVLEALHSAGVANTSAAREAYARINTAVPIPPALQSTHKF